MSSSAEPDPSAIKPLVTPAMALAVLQDHFKRPIQNLQIIQGGNVAQTFSFTLGSEEEAGSKGAQDYIVHFNAPMSVNFEKEAYLYGKFASSLILIPRVVHLGRLGEVSFAITEKLPGLNLLQIPRSDYLSLIPKLIELLDAIHQVSVEDRPGYGIFDGNGVAYASSWKEHLKSIREEGPAGDFYGNWHALFQSSFLEQELFESIYSRMMELSRYCTEERYLVHGDFGFGNVLAKDGKITAVLDWLNARYGDFLYDVSWLDFWSPGDGWRDRYNQHYLDTRRAVRFYSERILCCQCCIALDALKFYAKAGDRISYGWVKDRILSLSADSSPPLPSH
jgi:hygromycin-B 4-O-kinase